MFGNISPTEMSVLMLVLGILYLGIPIALIGITVRWARRVRIALEKIAANTTPG